MQHQHDHSAPLQHPPLEMSAENSAFPLCSLVTTVEVCSNQRILLSASAYNDIDSKGRSLLVCPNSVLGSQSPGWDSSTPKPFRKDSQLSAGEPLSPPTTLQRHGSFPLTGVSPRPLTPQSSSPLFGSGSDEGPKSGSVKPSGLFDMGSLTSDISDKGIKSPATRRLPSTQISSLRYRTSNMVSDDEDQGDSAQEQDSSMSEDDSSRHRRLTVGDIYAGPVLHSTKTYKNNRTNLILFVVFNLLRKSKSRQRHQGHGTVRQSLARGERLHDPYYQQQPQPPQQASGAQARAWSENVDLPYILSGYVVLQQYFRVIFRQSTHIHLFFIFICHSYVQVFMNTAIVGFLLYIIFNFITTIQSDVSTRIEGILIRERKEIEDCKIAYVKTHCATPNSYTAVVCEKIRSCMEQPEPKIGRYDDSSDYLVSYLDIVPQINISSRFVLLCRASVSAETIALIVNAFVHTISYKTMVRKTLYIALFRGDGVLCLFPEQPINRLILACLSIAFCNSFGFWRTVHDEPSPDIVPVGPHCAAPAYHLPSPPSLIERQGLQQEQQRL